MPDRKALQPLGEKLIAAGGWAIVLLIEALAIAVLLKFIGAVLIA
jgi:hypothetical protein